MQDEILLADLYDLFVRRKIVVATMTASGIAASLLCILLLTPQWEATAVVRIGQIGEIGAGPAQLIEPLAAVEERLELVPFQNAVLTAASLPLGSDQAKLYRKSIAVRPLPSPNLLEISLSAYSPAAADRLMEGTVGHLVQAENEIMDPFRSAAQARREALADVIAGASRAPQIATAPFSPLHASFGQLPLSQAITLLAQAPAVLNAREELLTLNEQLTPAYTYPTGLFESIYVPDRPAFPNRLLILLLGSIGGLVLGFTAAIIQDFLKRPRA